MLGDVCMTPDSPVTAFKELLSVCVEGQGLVGPSGEQPSLIVRASS